VQVLLENALNSYGIESATRQQIQSVNLLGLLVGKVDCRKPNQDVPAFRIRQRGYVFGKFEPPCSSREVISGSPLGVEPLVLLEAFSGQPSCGS